MDSDLISYEALIAAQETAKWTYKMMFATWFAGGATLAAVIVTLYLANRKPVASITSTSSTSIVAPPEGLSMMGISLNVANVGIYPAVISSISWECGGKLTLHLLFKASVSDSLPKKLEHGESAMFFIPFNDFVEWKTQLLEFIEKSGGSLEKLRYIVHLGTGKKVSFKLSKDLMDTLKSK
ncbi:hypothetical protein [Enterobacter bugandensis]|uniref:hypothetical protein n=1 Tax=Enterobacter bugandensis TaxID=881260 RepID=UPI001C41A828|nr:hypothetical protein [Enterobacter cloacae]